MADETEVSMDDRLKREIGSSGRRSREADDRSVTENRELSDDDRIEMFRMTLHNDVLPDLPPIPGYHVCWLSTTHPSDTIPRRMRLGYELIKTSDAPGMEFASVKTGQFEGGFQINEMVAFKLPMNLYQAFMHEAHHAAPAREAAMLAANVDSFKEQALRDGGDLLEGEGMAELRRSAPARGVFSD